MHTYEFKLYKSKNDKWLETYNGIACEIWNHCIALERRYYKMFGKHLPAYRMKLHITKLKKRKAYAHWKKLNSQAIQDVIERIDRSYDAFFDHMRKKKAGRCSIPHFRKRKDYKSFTLKQTGYRLDGNTIHIMGKRFKFFKSREIKGSIKTITVKKMPTGGWHIFIVTDYERYEPYARTGKAVGMDFGLKMFLTTSDGRYIRSPQWLKASMSEMKKASRNFSLKEEESNNAEKAKLRLAKLHEHIARQRADWFFKLANGLCREYDIIAIEDLNLKGMQSLWGRKVSDEAYGEFVRILEHVASVRGKEVVKVDRWYPSTKTCSICGAKTALSCKDREWTCPMCGAHHDRDFNAAVNIKKEALAAKTA